MICMHIPPVENVTINVCITADDSNIIILGTKQNVVQGRVPGSRTLRGSSSSQEKQRTNSDKFTSHE